MDRLLAPFRVLAGLLIAPLLALAMGVLCRFLPGHRGDRTGGVGAGRP